MGRTLDIMRASDLIHLLLVFCCSAGLGRTTDVAPPALLLELGGGGRVEPPFGVGSAAYFVPLYPVRDVAGTSDASRPTAVGYRWAVLPTATVVTSMTKDGSVRWNISVPHAASTNVSLGGGFDFDSDGFPDISLIYHSLAAPASSCGRYPMGTSDLSLLRGATGEVVSMSDLLPKDEQADLCWDFREPSNPVQTKQCNETHHCVCESERLFCMPTLLALQLANDCLDWDYHHHRADPTQQWTASESPMWGEGTSVLVFSPTYSQWAYQLSWNASTQSMDRLGKLKFPSCPLDDTHLHCAAPGTDEPYESYTAAKPNAFYALGETSSLCAAAPRNWKKCTINPHCE